jgi:HEAT repeat protein
VLTFAVEALATVPPQPAVSSALVQTLRRPEPYVREGALYGAAGHLSDATICAVVREIAASDEDEDLREIAAGLLEDLD